MLYTEENDSTATVTVFLLFKSYEKHRFFSLLYSRRVAKIVDYA